MKKIGLIGGMSWESTVTYYKIINTAIKENLGGLHSAECILYSVDFANIEKCQAKAQWEESGKILADAAKKLESAGADFIVICTNTMHKVAGIIQAAVTIPILHIADCTADELIRNSITKVGLLGTKYTMEQDFYKAKLIDRGIEVLVPEINDMNYINDVIYNELCLGKTEESSRDCFIKIMEKLVDKGAQGVILGCTEIGLIVTGQDTDIKLFDTTFIHAKESALYAIKP